MTQWLDIEPKPITVRPAPRSWARVSSCAFVTLLHARLPLTTLGESQRRFTAERGLRLLPKFFLFSSGTSAKKRQKKVSSLRRAS